jgi:hypothetical protein
MVKCCGRSRPSESCFSPDADGQADLAAARQLDPEIDAEYADYGLKP